YYQGKLSYTWGIERFTPKHDFIFVIEPTYRCEVYRAPLGIGFIYLVSKTIRFVGISERERCRHRGGECLYFRTKSRRRVNTFAITFIVARVGHDEGFASRQGLLGLIGIF